MKDMLDVLKTRNWPRLFGAALFISIMACCYYYNLTFVQIGLEDFGTRLLGLSSKDFARDMALLAVFTCLTALAFGFWMQRQSWRRCFQTKLRLSFGVVLAQTLLTLLCPLVRNESAFIAWLGGVSLTLGMGVPVMFSMTVDLVPVRGRGYAAALITGLAYFVAEVFSSSWTFEAFRHQSLFFLLAGSLGVGLLAFSCPIR